MHEVEGYKRLGIEAGRSNEAGKYLKFVCQQIQGER